jgi:hypothetical protein
MAAVASMMCTDMKYCQTHGQAKMRGARPSQTVGRAFTTALLLTANIPQAEAAVLDGIRTLESGDAPDDKLSLAAMMAAISPSRDAMRHANGVEDASSILPPELAPVLRLPLNIRKCFVLRVLLATPRERCARLLDLDVSELDHNICLAAQGLARIVSETRGRQSHSQSGGGAEFLCGEV